MIGNKIAIGRCAKRWSDDSSISDNQVKRLKKLLSNKRAMGLYAKLRWFDDTSISGKKVERLKKLLGNKFSKHEPLAQSELSNEFSSIESSSSDEDIFKLDDSDDEFDYKSDRDNELVIFYQNRECEVSNSQQDENVCLLNQGHDSHNINSTLSNLEDYNLRKVGPPHNKNKSPDNVIEIYDNEDSLPLATIGNSNKKPPINDITSARSCASPPIIIDQTELTQPQFSFDGFDIKLRDEVDNLRLSPASKMFINTTISQIRQHAIDGNAIAEAYFHGNANIYEVANFILNTLGTKKEFILKIESIESKNKFKNSFTIESRPFFTQVLKDSNNI